jgi:hypothetical protein
MAQCCMLSDGKRCTNECFGDDVACVECCDLLQGVIDEDSRKELRRLQIENAEFKVRMASLEEWRDSVSGAIKLIPEFAAGRWGGDKEGWGFHFEIVNWVRREKERLEAENERLRAPVSDGEWLWDKPTGSHRTRRFMDELIARRAGSPPK